MTSLGTNLMQVLDRMGESFFDKKKGQKRMFEGKKSWGRIGRLRSGKKDSVPFSKYFKTDQVFKTGSVPL